MTLNTTVPYIFGEQYGVTVVRPELMVKILPTSSDVPETVERLVEVEPWDEIMALGDEMLKLWDEQFNAKHGVTK
jgi:hypothetical protein